MNSSSVCKKKAMKDLLWGMHLLLSLSALRVTIIAAVVFLSQQPLLLLSCRVSQKGTKRYTQQSEIVHEKTGRSKLKPQHQQNRAANDDTSTMALVSDGHKAQQYRANTRTQRQAEERRFCEGNSCIR